MELFVKTGGRVERQQQQRAGGPWKTACSTMYKRPLEAAQHVCGAEDSILCVELAPRQFGFGVVPSLAVASTIDAERSAADRMHIYEVIQVHQPVRLYLDIDAQTQDGLQFDASLGTILGEHLQLVWPLLSNAGEVKVQCEVASCHRSNKFSFHVVAHVWVGTTAVLFENNLCLLPFIRLLKRECMNNSFIQAIDEAVYTRNRLMRTCYSAKQSAAQHPFVPEPGSSRQLADHLIIGKHAYGDKRTLILASEDCADGILPLTTPRPGFGGRGFEAQKIVLPPHAQTLIRLLSETIAIGSITSWTPKGVGGVIAFSSVDRTFPCCLFCQPRPHKGNNLRFVVSFACNSHDVLLQFCHDDHARYASRELFQRAVDTGKISSKAIADAPPAWGGDVRAMVQVPMPEKAQQFCTELRKPLEITQFSCW